MVDLYVALILHGMRTIDTIPAKFRTKVQAILDELGVDGEGNPVD